MTERKLKCPYNDFKDCLMFQCPFYGVVGTRYDDARSKREPVAGCTRAKAEANKSKV